MEETLRIESFKAGHFEKGIGYRYFVPTKCNTQWTWSDPILNELLEKASIQLGQLNSFAKLVPNIDLFIHLHVTKESVISSRIEGTQTNIEEALLPEEEISPERINDWHEVKNYTEALNTAVKQLATLPISSRLIRNTHEILLQGVRGESKQPGEFRTSQNWIGGSSLADAVFIPPSHQYVNDLMGDLENFLHNEDIHVPALIRIGIAHYQFETIHPFLDGNGRIGRLLITLYLVSKGILDLPLLYLSAFFDKNKSLYYDNLTRVREQNDLLRWLKYFLVGIEESSKQSVDTLSKVIQLKERTERHIRQHFGRRTDSALTLAAYLFKNPIVKVRDVEAVCSLSKKAANALVEAFEKDKIISQVSVSSRNRTFIFDEYIDLFM